VPEPWWKSAVVYQIYPRSLLDTDGDGVGDLEGIRRRLDHIAGLGVHAVWLSPFFRSPMADFGYDVADYCDVDPLFGTLADFDRLLAEAHDRGLKVLIDWVPNHTSDQHPWFVESRSSRDSPKRDWYVWRDPDQTNNWQAAFTGESAWTYDERTGQSYLHLFLPEQPDLNWGNPKVVEAMHAVVRFWLDRGVDGFRIDVVHALGKDPSLPDDPPDLATIPHSSTHDDPRTHPILRDLRRLIDSYPGERMMVGEVFLLDTTKVARYYGDGDELHLAFNFPPLFTKWDAAKWRRQIERAQQHFDPIGAWPTWVLSNHDNPRHRTRYDGRLDRARAAAVLLLTLKGTAFLYAGEELGLLDAEIPPERVVDPGGRDGCRAPIPWSPEPPHGWVREDNWLPWPPLPDDPTMPDLYRALLRLRRVSPALSLGDIALLDSPEGTLAYERRHGDDRRVVAINFTDEAVPVDLPDGTVDVVTGRYEAGVLGPSGAVVLTTL